MLLESNILLQMDLQWIFLVVIQKNVIVMQYLIWKVGIVIFLMGHISSGKLAGFMIKVSTLMWPQGHSSPGGGFDPIIDDMFESQ